MLTSAFQISSEVESVSETRARARPSHSFPPVITSAGTQPAPPSVPGPSQPLQRHGDAAGPSRAPALGRALGDRARRLRRIPRGAPLPAAPRAREPPDTPPTPPDLLRPPPPPRARSLGPPRPRARRRARPRRRPRSTRSPSRSGGGRPRSAASSAPRCAFARGIDAPPARGISGRGDLAPARPRARASELLLFSSSSSSSSFSVPLSSPLNPLTPTDPATRRPPTRAPGSGARRTTWSSTRSARWVGRPPLLPPPPRPLPRS